MTAPAEPLAPRLPDYLPGACWTVGGGLRFDRGVQTIASFLGKISGAALDRVQAVAPCAWSLDWYVQRRPLAYSDICEAFEAYARMGMGVILVFDNPWIPQESMADPYGLSLVQELYKRDRIRKNAVCVASDALAEQLRAACPQLPIYCHENRLVAEQGRRSPRLYNSLLTRYRRITLHPADAARPAILSALEDPARIDIVVNDSCLRTCPVRREHLQLLAALRRSPYDTTLMAQRASLIARTACMSPPPPGPPAQNASCNIPRSELAQLHAAGFRSYIIQSQLFRNEMTLLWDILQCRLPHTPEQSNKMALIANSAMAEFGKPAGELPSGLRQFSFSNIE